MGQFKSDCSRYSLVKWQGWCQMVWFVNIAIHFLLAPRMLPKVLPSTKDGRVVQRVVVGCHWSPSLSSLWSSSSFSSLWSSTTTTTPTPIPIIIIIIIIIIPSSSFHHHHHHHHLLHLDYSPMVGGSMWLYLLEHWINMVFCHSYCLSYQRVTSSLLV